MSSAKTNLKRRPATFYGDLKDMVWVDTIQSAVNLEGPIETQEDADKAAIEIGKYLYPELTCQDKAILRIGLGWNVRLYPKDDPYGLSTGVLLLVEDDGYIYPPRFIFDPDIGDISHRWLKMDVGSFKWE